jgi:hypothetical protein
VLQESGIADVVASNNRTAQAKRLQNGRAGTLRLGAVDNSCDDVSTRDEIGRKSIPNDCNIAACISSGGSSPPYLQPFSPSIWQVEHE